MSIRSFLAVLLTVLGCIPGRAQVYQSSFSEVRFDRAKTPSVIHGNASVDVPTGALSIEVPMGPGVGARGVRFTPVLSSRFSPQTPPVQSSIPSSGTFTPGGSTCMLTPGYLVIGIAQGYMEFLLPDGVSGQLVPSATTGDPMQLVRDFGLSGVTAASAFWGLGSNGELIIELMGPSYGSISLYNWQPT